MAVLGRPTLKNYFKTGQSVTNRKLVDLVDSVPNLSDTTAQQFNGTLEAISVNASGVSAGDVYVERAVVSGCTFAGQVRHGTAGFAVIQQSATTRATAQIANLPPGSSIVGPSLKVLAASSGADGGTQILLGNSDAIDFFGSITVSGTGQFDLTAVSATRLQNVSGAVFMAAPTATANSNFLGIVRYYQSVLASAGTQPPALIPGDSGTAIGDLAALGGLAAAFDGDTTQNTAEVARCTAVGLNHYVGKNWGVNQTIRKFVVYAPSNKPYIIDGTGEVTIKLRGKSTAPANATDGTLLATVTAAGVAAEITIVETGITQSPLQYVWVNAFVSAAGSGQGDMGIAEVEFYS